MSSKKLFRDLSANTIQTGITQVAGLVIFYVLSRYISKEDFGEYNWTMALGSTFIAVGSLGLDLVLVKRIASGRDPVIMAGIHFLHTIIIGIVLLCILFLLQLVWPSLLQYHPLFLLILVQLCISNIANSFKFSLTGLEAFKPLATTSVCLNIAKLLVVLLLLLTSTLSIKNAVLGFLLASILELALSYYFISRQVNQSLKPLFQKETYKEFITESLPQLGVVLFDSALARIDWILLGIFSTVSITAEYSFAYKFFELSKLPLLILAPVLLTRFSKLYHQKEELSIEKQRSIQQFFDLELFISLLIPIVMICVWTNLIDKITDNKYGAVNQLNYTILAICVPLHFVINFLWTMGFVQGQLKAIMYITIVVSLFNTIANIIVIPHWGSFGAALSFLAGTIIQIILYVMTIKRDLIRVSFIKPIILFAIALVAIVLSRYIFSNSYFSAATAILLYVGAAILTRLVSPRIILPGKQ